MLYPSGMLVARPAADGSGGITYTKHYFAGTQRVSSKIGTTTNLGKFLEEWQQQEQSSPSYPAITTQAQMDKAKNAANKVYTAFGISYTTPAGNTSFVPIAAFTPPSGVGGLETDHYFFHPDHLGSSNYITNFAGEVSQHTVPIAIGIAFGETFIEEHKNSHNSPYKFNGKELDEESGLYYYGARYYDPRISIWASVDPLANFNPFMDDEFYIDGDHNGGVFNHFNHNSYGYCYQNPVKLIDPNGKQALAGAVIGIFTEIITKIGSKIVFDGMSVGQAFKSLTLSDGLDIVIAGASGAAGTGITKLANLVNSKLGRKILTEVLKLALTAIEETIKTYFNGEDFSLSAVLVEYGFGSLLEHKILKKTIQKFENQIKNANDKIESAKREIENIKSTIRDKKHRDKLIKRQEKIINTQNKAIEKTKKSLNIDEKTRDVLSSQGGKGASETSKKYSE